MANSNSSTSTPIKISAVIPTYNREQLIGRAIRSALAQKYPALEIIVVDDGSSDNTSRQVQEFGDKVIYVFQPNSGVSAARNLGVERSRGDWVAFLDSDDAWEPFHLSRMADAITETNGTAALYFSDLQHPESQGGSRLWERCRFQIAEKWQLSSNASEWAMMTIQPMMLQASVILKSAYKRVGGLPEQFRTREDTFLFHKLALEHTICAVAGCGTVMYADDNIRLSDVYSSDSSKMFDRASVLMYKELCEMTLSEQRHHKFFARSLSEAYVSLSRQLWRERDYSGSAANLMHSFLVSPTVCFREVGHSIRRRSGSNPRTGSDVAERVDVPTIR